MRTVSRMGLSNQILEYIKDNDGTTFVEIEHIFEQNEFDYKGDLTLCSKAYPTLIFWDGWNQNAINILDELLDNELVVRQSASTMIYYIDGKVLNMPIAQHYKKRVHDAWYPIAFSINKKEMAYR